MMHSRLTQSFGLLALLHFLIPVFSFAQTARQDKLDYIAKYQSLAIGEMKKHGIPASITLAQGILESNSGKSELALKAKNHFGIKCTSDWQGKEFHQDDDKPNECFRKYENVEESFFDHSLFLKRDRYKALFQLALTDYQGWAKGLKQAGYATNPRYPDLLIGIIEEFRLFLLDSEEYALFADQIKTASQPAKATGSIAVPRKKTPGSDPDQWSFGIKRRTVQEVNGVPYILTEKGDEIKDLAREFDLFPWQLRGFNELSRKDSLKVGQRLFVDRKKKEGDARQHVMAEGETLLEVSQLYAIRLKSLRKMNGLEVGAEPRPGSVIRLR